MTRSIVCLSVFGLLGLTHCSSDSGSGDQGASGAGGSTAGAGGSTAGAGGSTAGAGGSTAGAGGSTAGAGGSTAGAGGATGGAGGAAGGAGGAGGTGGSGPSHDEVKAWVDAYKAGHPGNGGKDWDINAKTPAQVAADPDAQRLLALCGKDQRPVIPLIAWEYGGNDHQWINPQASALVYCVYIPVVPSTQNWSYDAAADRVTADVYVKFPDQNPCKDQQGANQVSACIGDQSNFEILVDTASLHDGNDVGLDVSMASTELKLILTDGTKVQLILNL